MNKITWAYIVEVIHLIVAFGVLPFAIADPQIKYGVNLLVLAAAWGLVANLLLKDAKARGKSAASAAWSLLGILGVFTYHIFLTNKNLTPTPEKSESAVLILGILSAVFGILFFPIGFILSIVALIMAILRKKEPHTQKTNAGLILGLAGLLFSTFFIISTIVGVSLVGSNIDKLAGMTADEAIQYCNEKDAISYGICVRTLMRNHINDSRVSSGSICNLDSEMKAILCITGGTIEINTEEFCNGIEATEHKTLCTAIVTENKELCKQLNSENKELCENEIRKRTLVQ